MNLTLIDPCLVAVMLLNFFLLATGRIKALISGVAFQGAILGAAYALAHVGVQEEGGSQVVAVRTLLLAAGMIAIKGFVMPKVLT